MIVCSGAGKYKYYMIKGQAVWIANHTVLPPQFVLGKLNNSWCGEGESGPGMMDYAFLAGQFALPDGRTALLLQNQDWAETLWASVTWRVPVASVLVHVSRQMCLKPAQVETHQSLSAGFHIIAAIKLMKSRECMPKKQKYPKKCVDKIGDRT